MVNVTDVSVNIQSLKLQKLQTWILAMRAPFFTASIVPLVLGMAVAFYETGVIDLGLGLMTLIAGVAIQAGTNLTNDYFDQKADALNDNFSQFTGGSRMIQNEIISPRSILIAAIISFIFGITFTLLLLIQTQGFLLLFFMMIAILLGIFYTAFPISLSYRGLGEIAVFVGFGPLGVYSAYYIQSGHINSSLLFPVSIPIALLISLVLFMNEFQDCEADELAGKKTLVVTLGKQRAVKIYTAGMVISYLFVLFAINTLIFPIAAILPLLTIPLAVKAISIASKNFNSIIELLPANGLTIIIHFTFGLIFAFSFVVAQMLSI